MSAIPNPFAGPVNVTDFAVPERLRLAELQLQQLGEPVTPLMKMIDVWVGSGANAPLPPLVTDRSTRMFDEKLIPLKVLPTGFRFCNEFAIAEEIPHKSTRPTVKTAREERAMKLSSRKIPWTRVADDSTQLWPERVTGVSRERE